MWFLAGALVLVSVANAAYYLPGVSPASFGDGEKVCEAVYFGIYYFDWGIF
jgi:hypothetical protein